MNSDIHRLHALFFLHSLNMLVGYFNEIKRVMNNERLDIREREDIPKELKENYDKMYSGYQDVHLKNSFLLMYSLSEEWFLIFRDKSSKSHGIDRFKKPIRDYLKDVKRFNTIWNSLKDFEKVRHCLLHANGRVDLFVDKKSIEQILKKFKSDLQIEDKVRLILLPTFLVKYADVLRELFDVNKIK